MIIDFTKKDQVKITMYDYVDGMLYSVPDIYKKLLAL